MKTKKKESLVVNKHPEFSFKKLEKKLFKPTSKPKKVEEKCPDGNNPLYCRLCFEARLKEVERDERVSRRRHGLS